METLILKKNDTLDLHKGNANLKEVGVALGWKANLGNGGDFDLDASCFLLTDAGKVVNGKNSVIFYSNPSANGVKHSGDDRVGGSSDSDQETIFIDFSKLDPACERIDFVVTIYVDEVTGAGRGLTFSSVKDAFARIYDKVTGKEIARFNLTADYSFANSIMVCSLVKVGANWNFKAIGAGDANANLNTYFAKYQ